jgi:glucose-1-phosphate cytidylyltransferase
MTPAETPVVILCGGRGTRLQEHTPTIPKPLVEIGGRPIVGHVIDIYAQQGFRDFTLCTGYKGAQIERWVEHTRWPRDVSVRCLDTGVDTPTGGRVRRAALALPARPFCATYGDGVADIDLGALLETHRAHGAIATMTVVRPRLQFGVAALADDDRVRGFHEKPRSEHWVNGGFFVFERRVMAYLAHDSVLERDPLEQLAAAEQLRAYRHNGFWDCMDTYKDAVLLNDLWNDGAAPWTVARLRPRAAEPTRA